MKKLLHLAVAMVAMAMLFVTQANADNLYVYCNANNWGDPTNVGTTDAKKWWRDEVFKFTETTSGTYEITIPKALFDNSGTFWFRLKGEWNNNGVWTPWNEMLVPATGGDVPSQSGYTVNWTNNYADNRAWKLEIGDHAAYKLIYSSNTLKAIPVAVGTPDDYYFVSTELTGGQRLESFKFSPSRVRGGGDLTSQFYTFNFQNFIMDANHKNVSTIHYWIEKGDGTKYGPWDDFEFGNSSDNINQGNNTGWGEYNNMKSGATATFILNRDDNADGWVSYTFMLDNNYLGSQHRLEILKNKKNCGWGDVVDAKGYYLTGNFTSASADVSIDPSTNDGRRLMTKYWYVGGKEYTEEPLTQAADSIVFRTTVPKPEAGWDNLYLAVFGATDIDDNWNSSDIRANWIKAIRPQVQWNYSRGAGFLPHEGLDATAMHGALFSRKSDSDDTQQALNPKLSDTEKNSYTSYTFSMNVTTSTYRISFNKDLFIMGPAVNNNGATDEACWSNASPDLQTEHAYKLTYDAAERCYKYMNGTTEAAIPFTAGKDFAFVYNKTFTNTIFMEDGIVPKSLVDNNGVSIENNVYGLSGDDDEATGNCDTQYVNYLTEGTTATAAFNNDVQPITFNLPSGEYNIRLYVRAADSNDPDNIQIYYVIKDRTVKFYNPQAKAVAGMTDAPDSYKSFYDYHAVYLPTTVQAYVVTRADKATKTVALHELTQANGGLITVETTKKVLPAKTPVILTRQTNEAGASNMVFEYYCAPKQTNTNTSVNLLKGQASRTHLEFEEGNNYNYNYIFGYDVLEGDTQATLGFFRPGSGECAINTAYLQVTEDLTAEGKGWTLLVEEDPITEETPEETVVDGIATIDGQQPTSGAWYTLQGVRVEQPSKGIYIHNGKKVVLK